MGERIDPAEIGISHIAIAKLSAAEVLALTDSAEVTNPYERFDYARFAYALAGQAENGVPDYELRSRAARKAALLALETRLEEEIAWDWYGHAELAEEALTRHVIHQDLDAPRVLAQHLGFCR